MGNGSPVVSEEVEPGQRLVLGFMEYGIKSET